MTGNPARDCKSVIVTGGSGMIGRATVEYLAASGCDVLAVDVNAAALAGLEKASSSGGRMATPHSLCPERFSWSAPCIPECRDTARSNDRCNRAPPQA